MKSATARSWGTALLVLLIAGCSAGVKRSDEDAGAKRTEEDRVRQTFTAFQDALKARDADKVWTLLDTDSQAGARRACEAVQAAYAQAGAERRKELEESTGLSGDELTGPPFGVLFLKTKLFYEKYDEVPGSRILDVPPVNGETATVRYREADGDDEELSLTRQQGEWKVSVMMPSVRQP
jgi:hypothetical protein